MTDQFARARALLQAWQSNVMDMLVTFEGEQRFLQDDWRYAEGGGGLSCVLSGGECFEKAGVNFSHIRGESLPSAATKTRPQIAGRPFEVVGVSIVVHPQSPYVPTCHANARYFEVALANGETLWWFGGGYDLTPYYGFQEDCQLWHQQAKDACEAYEPGAYQRFKEQCDAYFYLPHRQEARGIGGLFFDDLSKGGFDHCLQFIQNMTQGFCSSYQQIVQARQAMPWGDRERQFQLIRRGRYVEFNLLYDRGTLFGLQSNGRTESILMSLPPQVEWAYQWQPEPGSVEAQLPKDFLAVRDWLA